MTNSHGKHPATLEIAAPEAGSAKVCLTLNGKSHGSAEEQQAELVELVEQFATHKQALAQGDLSILERSLQAQALTLHQMTNRWLTLANACVVKDPARFQQFAELALKAQEQCRKTTRTLADLKNPKRATFIKHQQNLVQIEQAQATESTNTLEEGEHGCTNLDIGAATAAARSHQEAAALA